MEKPMIRGVLFDMDGVLIDSEPINTMLLQETCALQGCTLTKPQEDQMLGINLDTSFQLLNAWFPGRIDQKQFVDDWVRVTLAYVRHHPIPLKPGVTAAIEMLQRRGIPMAVCTSNDSQVVAALAETMPLFQAFTAIVTGDQVMRGKPAPDIYLEGAKRLSLPPAQCAGIEDSLNGVKAIRAAGMRSVMVPDTLPYGTTFAPYTDVVIPSLDALEETLFP